MKYEDTKKSTKYEVRSTKKTKPSKPQASGFRLQKGFTLLEVIIAVFLITIGITGISVVLNKTMMLLAASPSKLIAAYLAQEGIEIVRNIRDTNWVEAAPTWDDGLLLCPTPPCYYRADFDDQVLTIGGSSPPLNISSSGVYSYNPGDKPTKFYRLITISKINLPDTADPNDYAIKVVVRVNWAEKRKNYSFSAQENLYDWH